MIRPDKAGCGRLHVRPARQEDIPLLAGELARTNWEQVDLNRAIVYLAEEDGRPIGFVAARLIWQVEPLFLFPAFRRQRPRNARRRATLLLARAIEAFLADRAKNRTGIYSYFCFVKDRVFARLAEHYGLLRIYTGGRFYGKDL